MPHRPLVGLLGFKHDRALALRALMVSAGLNTLSDGAAAASGAGRDVHGVFAGLVLMTFHRVVLLLAGYQADDTRALCTYTVIVDVRMRAPTHPLHLLPTLVNAPQAKILRMSNDPEGAIVLQRGLEALQTFVQADTLGLRVYMGDNNTLLVVRIEACYRTGALGILNRSIPFPFLCQFSTESDRTLDGCVHPPPLHSLPTLANAPQAKILLMSFPWLIQGLQWRFTKRSQKRRGGDPARFIECMSISSADGLGIFWNTHQCIADAVAEVHIKELAALTPPVAWGVESAIDEKHQDRTLRLYAPASAARGGAERAGGTGKHVDPRGCAV
ncbi:hypothetical protein K438DRAFT_1970030 [Mycena galopus ATCC 62051]|nr:hypothetical protein K438DRAFT_1970030 [Mycena galopus ATCC 62051]